MEKELEIQGLKVSYKEEGSGPAVLILHGWGGSSDSWTGIQKKLASDGFQVFCPDLPGFGKSQTPQTAWGLQDYSSFVLNFLKELEIGKLDIVAHSFGGRIAVKLASEKPSFLKKLVLVDPAGIKVKPSLKTQALLVLASLGDIVFSLKPLDRARDAARNLFYFFIKRRDYVKANATMKETMKNILAEDISGILGQIESETLLVWGENDRIVPLKVASRFEKNISSSRLKTIPCGHSPHLEAPETLFEKISEFLK